MSEAKPNPEITQRAVLETKTVTHASPHIEQHKKEIVKKVTEKLKEDNTQGALEVVVKQEEDAAYTTNAESRIHITRDKDGKEAPEKDQTKRLKDATAAIKLANAVVKEGWPSTPAEQKALVKAMRPALMRMNPDAKAWFSDATHGEARMQAFIQEQLQNPRSRESIQKLLEERSQVELPDELDVPRELEFKKIEAARKVQANTDQQTEVTRLVAESKKAQARDFGSGDPKETDPNKRDGKYGARLAVLLPDKGRLEATRGVIAEEIRAKEARLSSLLNATTGTDTTETPDGKGGVITKTSTRGRSEADITAEITALKTELGNAADGTGLRGKLITAEADLSELNDLLAKKGAHEAQQRELSDQLKQLKTEHADLLAQQGEITAQFADAVKARVAWEKKYVGDLQKVLSDGMDAHYREQVEKAGEIQQQLLEEEMAKTKDPAEKKILEEISKRWYKRKQSGFIRTKEVTVPNKERIDQDYALLMTPPPAGGPEAIMRGMLQGTLIEDHTAGITRPMTQAEIDEKLADKEFVDKMQGQVINTLMTRRMKTARIAGGDLDYIAESPWGQSAINAALQNKEAVATLQRQMEEQGVANGKIHEFFSTKGKKKGALLGLLLAVITAGVVPGMMIKEIIKGEGT